MTSPAGGCDVRRGLLSPCLQDPRDLTFCIRTLVLLYLAEDTLLALKATLKLPSPCQSKHASFSPSLSALLRRPRIAYGQVVSYIPSCHLLSRNLIAGRLLIPSSAIVIQATMHHQSAIAQSIQSEAQAFAIAYAGNWDTPDASSLEHYTTVASKAGRYYAPGYVLATSSEKSILEVSVASRTSCVPSL